MKKVLSLSMGSSRRDHVAEVSLFGDDFQVQRIGTDGDKKKLQELYELYDGKVDAFGMGGFDLWVHYANRAYRFKEASFVIRNVKHTPVADGSKVKSTLEAMSVHTLVQQGIIHPETQTVMIPSATSRYFLYKAFQKEGFKVRWGDLAFGLGIGNDAMDSEVLMNIVAYVAWPLLVKVPFHWLYPVKNQDTIEPKYKKAYDSADIIAGDFHLIYKHLPEWMGGKTIITNTLTEEEIIVLKNRGVRYVISVTPEFQGRSFGTNVLEACICAHFGRPPDQITIEECKDLFQQYPIQPRIIKLSDEGDEQ
ncbi:MAG: quinate 5-dehydrogenase [Caldisericia bacterium]|nr:quinate 5-dehydrogenase [Caldisericia bacterium]MDD4615447.1 quinate 5-dehydrogenase [Caldisericia bacterium]